MSGGGGGINREEMMWLIQDDIVEKLPDKITVLEVIAWVP